MFFAMRARLLPLSVSTLAWTDDQVSVSSKWAENYQVNFDRLNRTDIPTYFAEPE